MTIPIIIPTRPASLKNVETVLVNRNNGQMGNNASSSKGTISTINATSLSFGPLAPGGVSETKIIYLSAPNAQTINNLKIALINTGDIVFGSQIFGIAILGYLDYTLVPTVYFQGLNSDDSPANIYNIAVGNLDNLTSQYVYLNVRLPLDQQVKAGVCRFKWYFDYS